MKWCKLGRPFDRPFEFARHLKSDYICTPAPSNPLGVKGGSETGTIGPPAAIGNAVVDALWHLGVREIQLPITPYAVWQALQAGKAEA